MTQAFLKALKRGEPIFWSNPDYVPADDREAQAALTTAIAEWKELAPLLIQLFPELQATQGRIQSDLHELTGLREALGYQGADYGRVFLKGDHALPVAGSIKARGGLFEVLLTARRQAIEAGVIQKTDDLGLLASPEARAFFAKRTIAVGSTGNLGLSVGIAASALGYKAVVHMSSDATAWKVKRLKDRGVEVVQHQTDYSSAVAAAREAAARDPLAYFVDDEDSELLFRGYSAAAHELNEQLLARNIVVSQENPVFLYLPCGIGGAPGGVAYGAKGLFGLHVHPIFIEPCQAPSALCQMMSGLERETSVYEFGLTNKTEADGMAVATMSQLVARKMSLRLAGVATVADDDLLRGVALVHNLEGLKLEPSAASGLFGPKMLLETTSGKAFTDTYLNEETMRNAVHIVWATGGSLVPRQEFERFLKKGNRLLSAEPAFT